MIAEYFGETLTITKYQFNKDSINKIASNRYVKDLWPLIYIISDGQKGEAYVGESTNAISRMHNHLANADRQKLNTLHLITCDKFNKSSTLDIESSLIKYISADGKYKLQNGNAGLVLHNYYQRPLYDEVFTKIWSELKKENLASKSLIEINNSDLFKYSPYKSLSMDQYESVMSLMKQLTNKGSSSIFVEGSAGTGKTILAIYLIKLLVSEQRASESEEIDDNNRNEIELIDALKQKYPHPEIALVIPMTSLRSTIKKVFKNIKGLSANMVIGPSEVLKKKYDIIIVDEAHRLKRRVGITNYESFDNNNRKLKLGNEGTELDWIVLNSKNQIFFYDLAQSIKPSDVRKEDFIAVKKKSNSPVLKLKSQMRVKGGSDYINYVDNLLHCRLEENHEKFESEEYEFVLFESLKTMIKKLEVKEKEHGLCRLIAGFSWEWKSKPNTENGPSKSNVIDIEIEGVKLRWNGTNKDWINSSNAINEVGCIHTTQGYDLNYAGIIIGNEISYDAATKKIVINKEHYHDIKGKQGITDPHELKEYIINIYKTMLFRGIKGTYVYACDKKLRAYLKQHIKL